MAAQTPAHLRGNVIGGAPLSEAGATVLPPARRLTSRMPPCPLCVHRWSESGLDSSMLGEASSDKAPRDYGPPATLHAGACSAPALPPSAARTDVCPVTRFPTHVFSIHRLNVEHPHATQQLDSVTLTATRAHSAPVEDWCASVSTSRAKVRTPHSHSVCPAARLGQCHRICKWGCGCVVSLCASLCGRLRG